MSLVTVEIPTALRGLAGNHDSVRVEGETVGDLLQRLAADYPQLKRHIFDEQGRLRSFVNVFVNDDAIRALREDMTPVGPKDVISIIPSVAGGADPRGAAASPGLDQMQIQRYSRHLIMPEVGMEGQKKLRRARVLVVGAGGLGSPALSYLAAAGVGTLGIVDFDTVDLTNLQRQIIYTTADVGRSKLEVAARRIRGMNPDVQVMTHEARLTSENALQIMEGYDLVVDGTDNFPTRYLVNDACVMLGIPNVYGSIFRFDGQASVFCLPEGPCYRCVYPEPPPPGLVPSCAEGGVLGVLPGNHRHHPGHRGREAHPGQGRIPSRPAARCRCNEDALQGAQAQKGPRLPCLRHASHRDETDRLRAVLRDSRRGNGGQEPG